MLTLDELKEAVTQLSPQDFKKFSAWFAEYCKNNSGEYMSDKELDFKIGNLLANNPESGARFSRCGNYRYALWRIWNPAKKTVMFVGLNPSKADATDDDPTIRKVMAYAKHWDFGGVYMVNCFPKVETDPEQLSDFNETERNDKWIVEIASKCEEVIFAWGDSKKVKAEGRDTALENMLPNAKILRANKNGSPNHPLYLPLGIERVDWLKK